jgi:hypothetical protein
MKIIFICGALEPGQDGVGDYTRRLAAELLLQGNEISIIALNDKSVTIITKELQESEGNNVSVLRIPDATEDNKRFNQAGDFITNFNPELLSLQYVPFSFQKKGLPLGLDIQLAKIGIGRKWHIMFHELWVGMDNESPFKHKIWGNLQRHIAGKLIKKLNPTIVHTQCRLYQSQLEKIGCKALHLPLFGNIAVVKNNVSAIYKDKDSLTFIIFGSIHPLAPVKEFVSELAKYGQINKLQIKLNFVGRCGKELDHWLSVCKQHNLNTTVLGEQNSATISIILSQADWGISTTPWRQIEKSGTVAAMLEHGLSVICVARSWTPNIDMPTSTINGLVLYKANILRTLFNYPPIKDSKIILKNIGNTFILDCK